MSETATTTSRIAGLAEDSQVISGVAVGVGDITRGLSGDRKLWPEDELEQAAQTLEGAALKALHSDTKVGEVKRAGFDPNRGVIYEAEVEDESLAERVASGGLTVSVEARHRDGGTVETDAGEAMRASDITFDGLALVQRGASPSASASPGEAAALSPADIVEALEEDPASSEGDASDIDISDSTETALENKVEEHNEDAPESKQVTLGMLKKVYRRGAGAWFSSNAGATQNQWAMARVNAFLEDLNNDRQLNDGNDNDLAPDGYGPASESNAALVEINGEEIDLEAPERVKNAVEAGFEAKEEYDTLSDCGTGVGESIGEAILNDELTADIILNGGEIADNGGPTTYLSSHEEDAPNSPPTEWSEDEWTDGCGPVQYALWGHYLDWFEDKEAELQEAMDTEDMAYHDEEADMAKVPDKYVFDNPGEAVESAQELGLDGAADDIIHTHEDGEDTVFMPAPTHDELMEILRDEGQIEAEDMAEMKNIGPVDFEGTAEGELDESEIPNDDFEGHYINAGENKSDSSFPVVDGDNNLRRGNVDAAWNMRGQGDLGMPRETAERVMLNLGLVFGPPGSSDNPISEDSYEEADEAGIEVGTPYAAQAADDPANTGEDMDSLDTTMTEDDTPEVENLQDRIEELEAQLSPVKEAYASALVDEDSIFTAEELADKFSVEELRERYEEAEAELAPEPEPDPQTGDSEQEASLSAEEQQKAKELRSNLAEIEGAQSPLAENQKRVYAEELAEIENEDVEAIMEDYS